MKTIVDFSIEHSVNTPDKTAMIMLGERGEEVGRLTYAEFTAKVKIISASLQQRYQVGDRALMLYRSGLEFIVAFLACQYAGVVPVPVSLSSVKPHHLRRIEHISQDADIALILTAADWKDEIENLLKDSPLSKLECLASDAVEAEFEWTHPVLSENDLAFLQYTSGSTGNPKGVMVTHRNLIHNSKLITHKFQNDQDTVIGGWLPFYHDMGLIGLIMQSTYLGASLVLMDPVSFIKRPANWLNAISKYRINLSGGPNFGFAHCTTRIRDKDIEGLDLSCLRVCFNGAEPVRAETVEAFSERFSKFGFNSKAFYPCYGLAEATLFVSGGTPGVAFQTIQIDREQFENNIVVPAVNGDPYSIISCGLVYDLDVVIVDPSTEQRLNDQQVGEIWIRGDSVALGYWKNEQETKSIFQAVLADDTTPEGEAKKHYMRSGDLGFFDQGELYITGRLKDLLIINGRNIYPQDIEQKVGLLDSRLVAGMAAVFSVEGLVGEQVVIVQELESTDEIESTELAALSNQIRSVVAEHFEVPIAGVVLIARGTIPRTTSGKIQRRKTKSLWQKESIAALHEYRLASTGTR